MTSKLKSVFLLGLSLLLTVSAFAQGHRMQKRGPQGGPEKMLDHLQESLELSDAQVKSLEPVFEETKTKMEALRDQDFETREARMEGACFGIREKIKNWSQRSGSSK